MFLNFAKAIYRLLMRLVSPFLDARSSMYLRRAKYRVGDANRPIRVAFFVFEPETWDKQDPVYREMLSRDNIDVDVVVVPSFNGSFSLRSDYGEEKEYFLRTCKKVKLAYEGKRVLDISSIPYDYVFYGDSYNRHMPRKLRSYNVVKHSKICYIPYGFTGSHAFDAISENREFYRNVYIGFTDSKQKQDQLSMRFEKNRKKGIQLFTYLGYPVLEKYYFADGPEGSHITISWTPRWSYDKKIGGSHFLEYKDSFVCLGDLDARFRLVLRPHPMMFGELSKKGLMTADDIVRYCSLLENKSIRLSVSDSITDVLLETDILITDFSSIIIMFFLTGRPVIYCDSSVPFNESYEAIREGMYIANEWDDVLKYVNLLAHGVDPLKEKRMDIIQEHFSMVERSAERIVDCLVDDYKRSLGR